MQINADAKPLLQIKVDNNTHQTPLDNNTHQTPPRSKMQMQLPLLGENEYILLTI